MARWVVRIICGVGWLVLAAGVIAPLVGMVWGVAQGGSIATDIVGVPSTGVLLVRSVTLAVVATAGALVLGLLPGAILGASRGRRAAVLTGLILAPLLIPPQVYAYAWGLALAPRDLLASMLPGGVSLWGTGTLQAGLISAAWLWPVVAMIIAAGWRSTGWSVYTMAMLDASRGRAFLFAVLPSLRPYVVAAGALVFIVSMLEYSIAHLMLSRVYATELMMLSDVGAPAGQIMWMAIQVVAMAAVIGSIAAWSVRGLSDWQSIGADDDIDVGKSDTGRIGRGIDNKSRTRSHGACVRDSGDPVGWAFWLPAAIVWLASVGTPVMLMAANLRMAGAWREGVVLFTQQWRISLGVSVAVGLLAVALSVGTVLLAQATGWKWLGIASMAVFAAALVPPVALAVGAIAIFNQHGFVGQLYTQTPMVWILTLVARYGAIGVVIAWLATGKRHSLAVDQARVDGAGGFDVLRAVLLPMVWPSLLAAGLIVSLLSLFEVVLTQMVGPVGFPSIALTLLNHMHYGRDDVVITTSLIVVAVGILVTQGCGWLLTFARK